MKLCSCCPCFKKEANASFYEKLEEQKVSQDDESVGPIVNISGEPKVNISGEPKVDISGEPKVNISVKPTVNILVEPKVDISVKPMNKNSDVPSTDQKEPPCALKVVLLGDAGVGKSALLSSFAEGKIPTDYPTDYIPTIGWDTISVLHYVNGIRVHLNIWESSSHERFRSINKTLLHDGGSEAFIIVYSTKSRFFPETLLYWIDFVRKDTTPAPEKIKIYLLGNKYGSPEEQEVSKDEVDKLAAIHNVEHHLVDLHNRDEVRKFLDRLVENSSIPSEVGKRKEIMEEIPRKWGLCECQSCVLI